MILTYNDVSFSSEGKGNFTKIACWLKQKEYYVNQIYNIYYVNLKLGSKWQNENKLFGVIFFENKLLLQPDVVFDSESNGRNFSSSAPPGGEKKLFRFFYKMASRVGVDVFSYEIPEFTDFWLDVIEPHLRILEKIGILIFRSFFTG